MLDTVLRRTAIVSLFIVPLIPLIVVNGFFFPFITGKNFLFRILIEIAAASYAILAVRNPQYRPQWSVIAGSLGAFLVIMGVATIFSENPFKSFWSNFERMEGYITLLHLAAYVLVLSSVLSTQKLWRRFFMTSVGMSVLLSFYGMLQLGGLIVINQGGVRLDATIGNAAYLAVYMLINIGITAFLLVRAKHLSAQYYLLIVALLLQLFTIYHTATRGALLGLLAGGIVTACCIAVFGREHRKVRIAAASGLAALLIVIGGFIVIRNTDFVQKSDTLARMATISLDAGKARFEIWNIAYQGFKERPILGWGQESFNYVFNKYYTPELFAQEPWFDRAHNIFLDWLIAGGVLGLLGYLALYVSLLYLLWRSELLFLEKSLLTGLVAGLFINNFFVFDNITSYILFFALIAYVHHLRARPIEWRIPSFEEKRALTRVAIPVVAVLFVSVLYFVNVRNILATNYLLLALSGHQDVSVNLDYFKKAIAQNSFASQEIREQLLQAAIQVGGVQQIPLEQKEAFFTLARDEMDKQIASAPNDARLYVFQGSFLRLFRQTDEAIPVLEKAHELSPGKQTILFELAFAHLTKGEPDKALVYAKQAYESATAFDTARITYAVIALYAGDGDLATSLLMERYDTVAVDNDLLVQAYADTNNHEAVLEIWKQRVQVDQGNAQKWLSLGSAFYAAGDRTGALEAIEKAVSIDPKLREQADTYIQEIQGGS